MNNHSRWIKYEEDREAGAERWGKAHISSLSFHALINLRLCLEKGKRRQRRTARFAKYSTRYFHFSGVFILDLEATNMTEVVYRIVEELNIDGAIEEEQKSEIMRVLLYKHKYVSDHHGSGHHGHHGKRLRLRVRRREETTF